MRLWFPANFWLWRFAKTTCFGIFDSIYCQRRLWFAAPVFRLIRIVNISMSDLNSTDRRYLRDADFNILAWAWMQATYATAPNIHLPFHFVRSSFIITHNFDVVLLIFGNANIPSTSSVSSAPEMAQYLPSQRVHFTCRLFGDINI